MDIEKPYLLFAGHSYYPSGGMRDYKGKFESRDDALEFVEDHNKGASYGNKFDWHHITDIRTLLEDDNADE